MSEVKWPWALNKNGEQVKIDSVKKSENEEYRCIICGERVIPRLGNIRQHHFYQIYQYLLHEMHLPH